LASTGAIRRFMGQNKSEFDPRKYLAVATKAMMEICVDRYQSFGTAGNASKIKAISLEGMYLKYQAGELNPKVK
jgi:fructose-bisphosphate aldolase class II